MDQPDVLYVYRCDACGHRGETHLSGDVHDGATTACFACGAPVKLEWDGGVTVHTENKQD